MDSNNFYNLTPDLVLEAVELLGVQATGEFYQLNSYENRVFEVKVEENEKFPGGRLIAKFYRPNRWSLEALKDEHQFLLDLKNEGVEVVAPLVLQNGSTISETQGMYYSIFPRFFGKMPDELLPGDFEKIGRTLAMIHNVGSRKKAQHRPYMNAQTYGYDSLKILERRIPMELKNKYFAAAEPILEFLDDNLNENEFIQIHGDCHRGNILTDKSKFFFVDFDDSCNGHPAQDFWMLTQGDDFTDDLEELLSGYSEIRFFNEDWIRLFEPLRGLRIIHYAKWIAQRWEDPSFPKIFPQYESHNYWAQEVLALEQITQNLP